MIRRPRWMAQVPLLSAGAGLAIGAHNALVAALAAAAAMFCFDKSFEEKP